MESVAETKAKLEANRSKMLDAIKTATIQQKALVLLDDTCTAIYYDCIEASEMTREQMIEALDKVYEYAHGANELNMCFEAHDDWRKRIEDDFKWFVEHEYERQPASPDAEKEE
jgi:hypothetical protein